MTTFSSDTDMTRAVAPFERPARSPGCIPFGAFAAGTGIGPSLGSRSPKGALSVIVSGASTVNEAPSNALWSAGKKPPAPTTRSTSSVSNVSSEPSNGKPLVVVRV